MAQNETFSLEKVQALRSYFLKLRNSNRGKPGYGDLDTTVKLCEQLILVMAQVPEGRPA
jgi:hypothetical protein